MKHSISILFTLVLCLIMGTNTFAQKGFIWDTYKIGITMADDTKVVENADNMFKSDNEDMTYNMFVFDKGYAYSQDLLSAAKVLSTDFGFQYNEDTKDLSGLTFSGKYLFGTSGKDKVLLAGLTDTDGTNLFVYVVLKKEDKAEAALNAINSLSK